MNELPKSCDMREAGSDERSRVARLLYESYGVDVLRLGYRYFAGDTHAAEDLVAETFARVIASLEYFEGRSTFRTWIFRVALNVASSRKRRRIEESWNPSHREPATNCSPLERALKEEERRKVRNALAQLNRDHRIVLSLMAAGGMSAAVVADILGIPEGTVWSRYARARIAAAEVLKRATPEPEG